MSECKYVKYGCSYKETGCSDCIAKAAYNKKFIRLVGIE